MGFYRLPHVGVRVEGLFAPNKADIVFDFLRPGR